MSEQAAVTIYGIVNCDSVKKARAWLAEHDVAYEFHALFIHSSHPPRQTLS